MQTWDLTSIDVQPHKPEVIDTEKEGRAIVVQLPAGEKLGEHQVHERAWLQVVSGSVELADAGGQTAQVGPGTLSTFEPNERHEVRALDDSRLLLLLSPWPGEGHPSRED